MEKNSGVKRIGLVSFLIIIGIWIGYVNQMSPSPLLLTLKDHFQIVNNDALLNLSVSIMFPTIILASLVGGSIEQRIGLKNLFVAALLSLAGGMLLNYVAFNYAVFLLGRALYGVGFGLAIPFIGSAIMQWYTPKQRELMNTINGLFPFVGALVSFGLIMPIYHLSNESWKNALGIWGFLVLIVLALWILLVREQKPESKTITGTAEQALQQVKEEKVIVNLLKRHNIRMLCIAFACDFFSYAYIAVVLPTFLFELGGMSETTAGIWAAVAFPAVGIFGAMAGGMMMSKTGKRKPSMALGQILKVLGTLIATLLAGVSVWFVILGVAVFGFGNALWMPGLYMMPMELEDMTPTRVGTSFALISSFGFVAGFISPIVGGWITNGLMTVSKISDELENHVFGLRWSILAIGLASIIGFICIQKLKETGPAVQKDKLAS